VDELNKLLHCILSHHGQLEYGSPVTPVCVEAFLLAQADMTDARLAEIASAGFESLARDAGARWARDPFHFKNGIFVGDWPHEPNTLGNKNLTRGQAPLDMFGQSGQDKLPEPPSGITKVRREQHKE
jgi:hypothetical protein